MGIAPCRGRRRRMPVLAAVTTALWLAACAAPDRAGAHDIRVPDMPGVGPVVEVHSLQGLEEFAQSRPDAEQWQQLLSVFVVPDTDLETPAILGSYEVHGDILVFVPRYGLSRGLTYRARLDTGVLSSDPYATTIVREFTLPAPILVPNAAVTAVYPSADRLPENLLRFYIHFTAAMARGQAYQHVRLFDARGEEIEDAFLELGEELWDRTGTRFTLLFDPGRIKRGLVPREEVGPVLEQGNTYTLVVDAAWHDADGQPMVGEFRKPFAVTEPAMGRLDPEIWSLRPPRAGARDPLVVTFPHAMDRALLDRMVWITDAAGEEVVGEVTVDTRETRWIFAPDAAWQAGAFQMVIDTTIEDIAGNTVKAPFDVDVFETGQRIVEVETTSVPFEVRRD